MQDEKDRKKKRQLPGEMFGGFKTDFLSPQEQEQLQSQAAPPPPAQLSEEQERVRAMQPLLQRRASAMDKVRAAIRKVAAGHAAEPGELQGRSEEDIAKLFGADLGSAAAGYQALRGREAPEDLAKAVEELRRVRGEPESVAQEQELERGPAEVAGRRAAGIRKNVIPGMAKEVPVASTPERKEAAQERLRGVEEEAAALSRRASMAGVGAVPEEPGAAGGAKPAGPDVDSKVAASELDRRRIEAEAQGDRESAGRIEELLRLVQGEKAPKADVADLLAVLAASFGRGQTPQSMLKLVDQMKGGPERRERIKAAGRGLEGFAKFRGEQAKERQKAESGRSAEIERRLRMDPEIKNIEDEIQAVMTQMRGLGGIDPSLQQRLTQLGKVRQEAYRRRGVEPPGLFQMKE